jgi:[phosphatase 2A protein]-leucine-carboxy methyltransferase
MLYRRNSDATNMASIPNLNTLRRGRGGPRLRRGGRGGTDGERGADEANTAAVRDKVIRQTDHDASSSRVSAVALGYLDDRFATTFYPPVETIPKRYPIINRGTYVRTKSIDRLIIRFLEANPTGKKQIVSLGAGSDTRFFRFLTSNLFCEHGIEYHELDFEENINQKRTATRDSPQLATLINEAEKHGSFYRLHAIDLRVLTAKSPPVIPNLDPDLPTLLLSECCLCYLPPDEASSGIQYFTMHIKAPLALVLYEPIRPFDAFGKTMVSNLGSRGIHLQTLKRYSTLEAQRQRLRLSGFTAGQGARDVYELWESDEWVSAEERERIEKLEWLDEIEEWKLLASHYCVAWGWRGDMFNETLGSIEGSRTDAEARDDDMG